MAVSQPTIPGIHLSDSAVDVRWFGASPSASAAVNTAAIQRAINAAGEGGRVTISQPGTYQITQGTDDTAVGLHTAIYLLTRQHLQLGNGVVLQLANGANCYMATNRDHVAGNAGILIEGGEWLPNADAQTATGTAVTGWPGHAIWMHNADGCVIRRLRMGGSRKYCILIDNSDDWRVEDIDFHTPKSDGVHVSGPAHRGVIRNLRGTTGDNMVGITSTDYAAYVTTTGNITGLLIEDLYPVDCFEPVRLTGASPDVIEDITIRNITGSLAGSVDAVVRIMDDGVGGLSGCVMRRISVQGINCSGGAGGGAAVRVSSHTAESVIVRDVHQRGQLGVSAGGAGLKYLLIDGIYNIGESPQHMVRVDGSVERLTIRNAHCKLPAGTAKSLLYVTGSVGRLLLEDCYYNGGDAAIFNADGSIADGRLGHFFCESATYFLRGGGMFRGGNLRLKDTTYLVHSISTDAVVDLDALQLEGTSTGRTFGSSGVVAKAHAAPRWHSYRLTYSDFSAASTTANAALVSLPRGAVVHAVRIKHAASFTGGSISAYTISVGTASNVTKYAPAFDVFQAVGFGRQQLSTTAGLYDTNSNEAVIARATSTGGNLNTATAGVVDIEILWSVAALPN